MSILKVNTIQDKGGNAIISSDGSGNLTQSFASNTPSFWVALSSNQSISHDTSTKIQFNTVTLDTNSDWDSSNYRFTPSVAGYYFIYAKWRMSSSANSNQLKTELKKNGTEFSTSSQVSRGGSNTSDASGIVYLNGSTDYIEAYGYHVTSVSETIAGQTQYTLFQGFKIIGA